MHILNILSNNYQKKNNKVTSNKDGYSDHQNISNYEVDMIHKFLREKLEYCNQSNDTLVTFKDKYITLSYKDLSDEERNSDTQLIDNILSNVSQGQITMYAAELEYSYFQFNPGLPKGDSKTRKWGIIMPPYFEDGDTSVFLSCDFSYGMISIDEYEELYVFGDKLINEFLKYESKLSIKVIPNHCDKN